jgi:hypothetical protein
MLSRVTTLGTGRLGSTLQIASRIASTAICAGSVGASTANDADPFPHGSASTGTYKASGCAWSSP